MFLNFTHKLESYTVLPRAPPLRIHQELSKLHTPTPTSAVTLGGSSFSDFSRRIRDRWLFDADDEPSLRWT